MYADRVYWSLVRTHALITLFDAQELWLGLRGLHVQDEMLRRRLCEDLGR